MTRRARGAEAEALAERRAAAREARDWAEADRLRDELRAMGGRCAMARKDRSSSRRADGGGGAAASRAAGRAQAARGADHRAAAGLPRGGRDAAPRGGPRRAAVAAVATAAAPAARGPADAAEPLANVVYGRNAVREALRGRRRVRRVWATEATAKEGFAGARVQVVAADEVTARCGTDAHQGVCAEVDPYPYADAAELLAAPDPFVVALDEVTDPQNLGAVIRTAECAGATGVVIPERRSAAVTGAVAKASAGAVEHLPVARVRNLADFLAEAKAGGLLDLRRRGRRAHALRGPGLLGRGRPGARRGGPRAAPAGRRRVRRAGLAPAARAHRLAQRQRRRSGPDVRDLAEKA